jgi:rhodanese-related sulfurtransferase
VARELRQAGYEKARALVGGWALWEAAGMPVEKK